MYLLHHSEGARELQKYSDGNTIKRSGAIGGSRGAGIDSCSTGDDSLWNGSVRKENASRVVSKALSNTGHCLDSVIILLSGRNRRRFDSGNKERT